MHNVRAIRGTAPGCDVLLHPGLLPPVDDRLAELAEQERVVDQRDVVGELLEQLLDRLPLATHGLRLSDLDGPTQYFFRDCIRAGRQIN